MIPGRGTPLDITFSYNSVDRFLESGYGRGWTFSFNMYYYHDSASVVIVQMDGRRNRYFEKLGGGYERPTGVFEKLVEYESGKFSLEKNDGTVYYFENPEHKKLTRIVDRYDNTVTLTYTNSLLSKITDAAGRNLFFTWSNGHMTQLQDPNFTPERRLQYEYDSQGNLIKVTDPLGNYNEYKYDQHHNLTAVANRNGVPVNIEYSGGTAVKKIISCTSTKTISYNRNLLKTSVVEVVGGVEQITTYEYDTNGRMVRQSGNCCGYDLKLEYDNNDNIVRRTDANGNTTTFTYDAMGNVLKEIDPLGNAMIYTYEAKYNLLKTETDRNGNTTTYQYDDKGNLVQRMRPLGIVESFAYDGFGYPTSITNGKGYTTTFTYNNNGYVTSITDPENGTFTMQYDAVGNNILIRDQKNRNVSVEYDKLNRETKITNALGYFIEYTYDPVGNQTSYRDQNGHLTTFSYNGVNRVTAVVSPLGHSSYFSYDEHSNIIAAKDANGHETFFEYNTLNRLVKKTSPVGDVTLYDYDGMGNLITAALPGGNAVQVVYDKLNRITQISDALGPVAKYTYDKNSNRLSVTDGNDNTTLYTYDAINRMMTTRDPSGNISYFTYDKNDNLTLMSDRRGSVTSFTYDKLNRRRTIKDPLNNLTTINYDPVGNVLAIRDAQNHTTSYSYDALDRLTAEIYPNGDQRVMSYDAVGNIVSLTESNGYIINFNYDAANRLLNSNYPNGDTKTYTYDNVGQILTAANPHSTVTMAYDAADRMISETMNGRTTAYTYNTNDRTRRLTYPGGKQVLEQYDLRGRLQQVQDNTISATDPLAGFEYDPGNRLLRRVFYNNAVSEYAYDLNSNIVEINHLLSGMVRYDYAYDNNDNKLYEKNNAQPTRSNQFLYDVYNRLTRFKKGTLTGDNIPAPSDDILYNYDGVHNRQSVQANAVTTTYTTNNLNQYTMLAGGISATLSYDAKGNLLSEGTNIYAYDFENRLMTVNGGTTAKYFYDALDRRILKVAGPDSTFYEYAQLRIIEERNTTSGPVTASFVYGADLDEVLTMQRGGQTYFYHQNALGSVTQITNTAGVIVEQYEYDAYGQFSIFNGAYAPLTASVIGNPVLFTGQRYDTESGLFFYKARYYSPVLGRFMQRDPLGFVDGMSVYEYAVSNPSNYTDPMGLCSVCTGGSNTNFEREKEFANNSSQFINSSLENANNFSKLNKNGNQVYFHYPTNSYYTGRSKKVQGLPLRYVFTKPTEKITKPMGLVVVAIDLNEANIKDGRTFGHNTKKEIAGKLGGEIGGRLTYPVAVALVVASGKLLGVAALCSPAAPAVIAIGAAAAVLGSNVAEDLSKDAYDSLFPEQKPYEYQPLTTPLYVDPNNPHNLNLNPH